MVAKSMRKLQRTPTLQKIEQPGDKVVYLNAIHNKTQQEVEVKAIPKRSMTLAQIEDLRDQIKIQIIARHPGIIRLIDYFEHRDFFFICFEKKYDEYEEGIFNDVPKFNRSSTLKLKSPI